MKFNGISGDADLPPDGKMPDGIKFSFALDSASRTLDLKGMRTGALTKFIELVKKMEGKPETDASRVEAAQILKQSVPLFDTASFNSTIYGLSATSAGPSSALPREGTAAPPDMRARRAPRENWRYIGA